jgi:cell division protein FtsW
MYKNIDIRRWWIEIDKINFYLLSTLLVIGLILSYSLSDSLDIFNKHLLFSLLAFILMIFFSFLEIKTLRRLSLFFLLVSVVILFIILFTDYEINGSKRWLIIYGFSLQPSEFIKPFYFILSAWLIIQGINGRTSYLFILVISFIIINGLIIMQPDFGMTFLISITFFCQLFIAGLSMFLVILALISLIILGLTSYYFFDHVKRRIDIFLDPLADTYQIDLSINAFKSGGLFGKGPGQGILKEKIPDANTDFIFAVAGEELGFIICSIIILLILVIIIRILLKLLKMNNPFLIISIVGLTCCFGLQSLINIFSSLSLIPTKGMTLPYISYGGSSMISSSILFGFLLSLTKNKLIYE